MMAKDSRHYPNEPLKEPLRDFEDTRAEMLKGLTSELEWHPVKIKQSRGPTLHFQGKLLASTEWEARDGAMRLELWQTKAGALIPVTRTSFDSGREIVSATVVEPIKRDAGLGDGSLLTLPSDTGAMRFAVMDAFDWNDRARSMVRKLGWALKQVVE